MEIFRLGDQMPVWTRFSAPIQTDHGVHPALFVMRTVFRCRDESDQGVVLTASN
jgi:hypothetical protein